MKSVNRTIYGVIAHGEHAHYTRFRILEVGFYTKISEINNRIHVYALVKSWS